MNIMVVDDEEGVLQLINRMLRPTGHHVIVTTKACDVLQTIEHEKVDLLISDVCMPTITGPQLVATVRQVQPGMPVLYMSGTKLTDKGLFLVKPFHRQELLNAIQQAVAAKPSPD
jgi:two-component system, cell cycle sensor histidine kinase and response regulator CckA